MTGPDELAEEARSALVQASGVGNTFPLDTFDTQGMRKHTVINCEKVGENYQRNRLCLISEYAEDLLHFDLTIPLSMATEFLKN